MGVHARVKAILLPSVFRKEPHYSPCAGISDKLDGTSVADRVGLGKRQGANTTMKNFIHS